VSWVRAFKAAGLTIIYWIAWGIVGGLFIFGGILSISGAYRTNYYGTPVIDMGRAAGGIILAIIGFLIMMLGFYATIYKVGTEIIVDEVKTIGVIRPVPSEGGPQVITRICPQCGRSLSDEMKFCPYCGKELG